MSDLSNDTKKHTTKSRETIPLNHNIVAEASNILAVRGKVNSGHWRPPAYRSNTHNWLKGTA
jgi:hypothetical protein